MERVGVLEKGGNVFVIWRDGYKYFVEVDGGFREYSMSVDLEEWVDERLRGGYKLELEEERGQCMDLGAVVAGRGLRDWYNKVLSYEYGYEYTEGERVCLWLFNKNLDEAIAKLSELDEWKDWRDLLKWEREILKECFVKVMSEVWRLSWEVVRTVLSDKPQALAECRDWRKGKFSRGTIEEAMLRITKIGLVRNMGEKDVVKDLVKEMVEEENEEWKEWLAKKVWLNLAEELME
jgi:hypothetical protein